jgi:predicted RNA-binding Zn-ribbon protein involved in translation (DUF1610 family)
MHKKVCEELTELYRRKNHDYGDSFHITYEKWGLPMAAIRLGDKLQRFETLIRAESAIKDESIRDTLIDLSNYAIMTVMELDRIHERLEKQRQDFKEHPEKIEKLKALSKGFHLGVAYANESNQEKSAEVYRIRCVHCGFIGEIPVATADVNLKNFTVACPNCGNGVEMSV